MNDLFEIDNNGCLLEYKAKKCRYITGVLVPECVTSICDEAFAGATSIQYVHLPDTCKKIGARAFLNCRYLKKINLDEVLEIDVEAFVNCKSLEEIRLKKIERIAKLAFDSSGSRICSIEGPITELEEYVFWNCKDLTKLDMSNSYIRKIGESACDGCIDLSEVSFSEHLECIGKNAFLETSLNPAIVPKGVIMGENVFGDPVELKIKELDAIKLSHDEYAAAVESIREYHNMGQRWYRYQAMHEKALELMAKEYTRNDELWETVCARLEDAYAVSHVAVQTFIRDLNWHCDEGKSILILSEQDNDYFNLCIVKKKYNACLKAACTDVFQRKVEIIYDVAPVIFDTEEMK